MVASTVVGLGLITMVGVWICYSGLKFFPRANLVTWPAASGDDVMARMDLCDLKEGGLSTSLLELSSTGEAKQKSLVRVDPKSFEGSSTWSILERVSMPSMEDVDPSYQGYADSSWAGRGASASLRKFLCHKCPSRWRALRVAHSPSRFLLVGPRLWHKARGTLLKGQLGKAHALAHHSAWSPWPKSLRRLCSYHPGSLMAFQMAN
ncbi:hypothetical protein BHE74_00056222 [Ensete ventricosum]|nr:hypothetical protein BHE74_00056222 [Ensete ventricosum]